MIFGQKWQFLQLLFFFGKIGQENVFYAILQRKNAFLGYKNKKIEKSKNCHFSKGVNPWFQFKNGHFFNFLFLDNKGQGNVFYDILERKDAFLGNKNNKIKQSKNYHFSKGVNPWFWSKNALFFNFSFFRQHRPGKFLLLYSTTKKPLFQTIKKGSSKSRKNAVLPKGLTRGFGPKMTIFPTSFFQAKQAREMSFTIF